MGRAGGVWLDGEGVEVVLESVVGKAGVDGEVVLGGVLCCMRDTDAAVKITLTSRQHGLPRSISRVARRRQFAEQVDCSLDH